MILNRYIPRHVATSNFVKNDNDNKLIHLNNKSFQCKYLKYLTIVKKTDTENVVPTE